jgi:pimeloyl-ACP methyl ester carboxylesterase
MAEQAAIGQDVVDFAEALRVEQCALSGFDWGLRAACITSILHPALVKGVVAIGGYSVQNTIDKAEPAPAMRAARMWYQWYFNTEQGRVGLEQNRRDIVRYLWETWAPTWTYTDEAFNRSAPSFDNPDFVDVVIHSYRHRHRNAPGEERFLDVECELAKRLPITVPSIVLRAGDSGLGAPSEDPSEDEAHFTNLVARRIVSGAGHDLPVQRPDAVSAALLELLSD